MVKRKTGRKKSRAVHKANKVVKATLANMKSYERQYKQARAKAELARTNADANKGIGFPKLVAKYERQAKAYDALARRRYNTYKSIRTRYNQALQKKKRAENARLRLQENQKKIANRVKEQETYSNNEGHMALYPTDGSSSNVVFFAPVNSETESTSSNVTSWAIDKGAPRSSYARVSSTTISLDGLLSDTDEGTAEEKYKILEGWNSNHETLTFKGDIVRDSLLIQELHRQYNGNTNTLECSITLNYVRSAEVTTQSPKRRRRRTSKSSKTTRGRRHKRYTAITVKRGDTLWGFSRKYHTSVNWLAKVNHIKNPNLILIGQRLNVPSSVHTSRRAKRKIRVR